MAGHCAWICDCSDVGTDGLMAASHPEGELPALPCVFREFAVCMWSRCKLSSEVGCAKMQMGVCFAGVHPLKCMPVAAA